jgi:hypothetical protein
MARNDYVPQKDADFLTFHDNFKAQAVASGTTYNLTAGEVTSVTNDNADFHTKFGSSNTADVNAKNATTAKNMSRLTAETRVRLYAKRIKAAGTYNPAIGDLYGINGPEDTTNLTTSQPTLKGKVLTNGQAQIDFTNPKGDGINLYCKRGAEADVSFLARDTESPYIDTRALLVAGKPELREYKGVYVQNGVEVGVWSAEIVVNCAP